MKVEAATKSASTSADAETNCPSRGKEGGPSLNSLALARKSIQWTYGLSDNFEEWRRAIYKGVLLKNETQKFWVDEKLHKNCFLVLPKACDIAGDDEESCWYWITVEENWFHNIYVPESKKLSWLLIQGRFETRALSPNTTYEVAFVVKLNRTNSESPSEVKLELVLPDGTKLTNTEYLRKRQEEWTNLRASVFMMGPETVGTIYFALQGTLNPQTTGLILKGVRIHPMD